MNQLLSCPVCDSHSINSFIETTAQMHSGKEVFNFDQCAECQLVFLNPRVDPEDLKNYYTDYYLPYRGPEAWGKYEYLVKNSQEKTDLKRLKRVKKSYSVDSNSLILDIGCGKPSFLKTCKTALNCKTKGIDFTDEGWKNYADYYQNLDLQVGEINQLDSNLKPDVITMWHYLEHDYSPLENLKSLRNLSKPDTTLVIEIPNFDSESRKKFGSNWAGWHTPRHTFLFSPKNVQLLLKKAGWTVEHIDNYGTMDAYLLYWMSRMEQKGIQWNKSMESEFWSFVRGMLLFEPKKWLSNQSLGVMTVVAQPANS